MNIVWHGYSCFRITENTHAGEVAVVTDPYASEGGQKLPRNLTADIVLSSHDHARHNNIAAVGGNPFVINSPGEFEVKEISVSGVPTYHDLAEGKEKGVNTMFYLVANDIHLVHLGDLKHKLAEQHMEEFHEIDVLMVPVGGGDVLDAKAAAEVIGQLEPRVIIPMHYRSGGLCSDCAEVEAFLKVMGAGKIEAVPKLKLTAKDLPQDEMRIILLSPQ